ncbi:MAG: glycosyltransferase family 4 protein [Nibricoccus sp.]
MKVLVVSEPGVDGVFRYVESLCHFLIEHDVEVNLAYSDRRACDRLYMLVRWIEERGGETVNLHTGNRPALSDLNALQSLYKLARKLQPDVIHSHSSKAGALARILPCFGIKAVQFYNPHAYVGMRPQAGKFDWLYNFIEGQLGRRNRTIVSSTDEKKFARQRLGIPAARIHHLPNGVDTDVFSPVSHEEKCRLREKLGLPVSRPILGFIGRSSAQKDPLTLYRAFMKVAKKNPVVLFHVGRGELDAELDALVESSDMSARVHRVPYMSTPADFYRVVDGFILTSRYEGFSIAALEAISANLPVILSQSPGNMDLLAQPLSHAWSARIGDVDGFAFGIEEWFSAIQSPKPINHRQIASAEYDQQEKFGILLGLYHDLAGTGSSRVPATSDALPSFLPQEKLSR